MCEMKAIRAINGFSCMRIFYGSKVKRTFGGPPMGHICPYTFFKPLCSYLFTNFFFFKLTLKNFGFSVTSIFNLIFQKLQFPNSIFLRIPFSNKFPKFHFLNLIFQNLNF